MAGAVSPQRRKRISDEPGFLLHRVAWRETSLVLDVFTRHHGRIALIAKGARRPRSELRPVLLAFQPLRLAWIGKGELQTLTAAEWVGGIEAPQAQALMCAFYLNELLMRLLPRDDAHPQLYDAYLQALIELTELEAIEHEECLRRFEWTLLRESGYAPDVQIDCDGAQLEAHAQYRWIPDEGFRREHSAREDDHAELIDGHTLHALGQGVLEHGIQRQQAKRLMRRILSHRLEGRALHTRKMLFELQAMTRSSTPQQAIWSAADE
ncbi:MAG: DNA repair protein RecO [Betaproteobacteria bacterium]